MPLPRWAEDVEEVEMGEELCLLHGPSGDTLVLNRTAADVWRLVDGATDSATMTTLLAKAYDVPAAAIEQQVDDVLDDLGRRGFLRWGPE